MTESEVPGDNPMPCKLHFLNGHSLLDKDVSLLVGHPTFAIIHLGSLRLTAISYILWLFNIAMENGPFIDGLPIKNGDFPWPC